MRRQQTTDDGAGCLGNRDLGLVKRPVGALIRATVTAAGSAYRRRSGTCQGRAWPARMSGCRP